MIYSAAMAAGVHKADVHQTELHPITGTHHQSLQRGKMHPAIIPKKKDAHWNILSDTMIHSTVMAADMHIAE